MDLDRFSNGVGPSGGKPGPEFPVKNNAQRRDKARGNGDAERDHAWTAVKLRLRRDVGEATVDHWIEPMAVTARVDGVVTLSAPTQSVASHVRADLGERLKTAWRRVDPSVTRLRYVVDPTGFPAGPAMASPAPTLLGQAADPSKTFDRFILGKPNRAAYVAARAAAEGAETAHRPVLILGETGAGKSHLAHAIADRRAALFPREQVCVLPGAALRDWIASSDWAKLSAEIAHLDVGDPVVIDGVEALIDAPRRALAERFVKRCAAKGRLLAATLGLDRAAEARRDWAARLLGDQIETVEIEPTDPTLRGTLLTSLARRRAPKLGVDGSALIVLAERLDISAGALADAYDRLCALADAQHRRATRDFARAALGRLGAKAALEADLDRIVAEVSRRFHVETRALRGFDRQPALIRARRIALYLSERLSERSLEEIGDFFGGRSPELVRAAQDWVRAARRQDGALDHEIEALRSALAR